MVFSSLVFLFLFLPLVIIINYWLPSEYRNGFLLVANLIFYAFGEPIYVLLMVASILVNYICARLLDKFESAKLRKLVMIEASDDAAAKRIEEAFNSKIEAFTQQSKNYDAANYALAQKCEVQKNGMFYAMFLSPDFEEIKAVYDKHIN